VVTPLRIASGNSNAPSSTFPSFPVFPYQPSSAPEDVTRRTRHPWIRLSSSLPVSQVPLHAAFVHGTPNCSPATRCCTAVPPTLWSTPSCLNEIATLRTTITPIRYLVRLGFPSAWVACARRTDKRAKNLALVVLPHPHAGVCRPNIAAWPGCIIGIALAHGVLGQPSKQSETAPQALPAVLDPVLRPRYTLIG